MNKWETIPMDEQETIIHLDYKEKRMNIWTNRKVVANKLKKVLLTEPEVVRGESKIYALNWHIPFDNRKEIRSCLSINRILSGAYKSESI